MKKLFGLFGGEEATVLTAEEKLEIISNKAQDTYDFGTAVEGESKFVIGIDGYDVEEITEDEMQRQLEESKKQAVISRLMSDPSIELKLEDGQHVEAKEEADPWGRVSDKGRIAGSN